MTAWLLDRYPANNHHNFDFSQLGVRVPAVVCSPWIPRNLIDHRDYEHASVPSTVERLWHLPPMTDRDVHAHDLTDLLSLKTPRTNAPTTLPEAATPEVECPDDSPATRSSAALSAMRPPGATLIAPALVRREIERWRRNGASVSRRATAVRR